MCASDVFVKRKGDKEKKMKKVQKWKIFKFQLSSKKQNMYSLFNALVQKRNAHRMSI